MKRLLLSLFLLLCIVPAAGATDYYQINSGVTTTITEHGSCRKVTNGHASTSVLFVPTKTSPEWAAFYTNLPAGVTAASCLESSLRFARSSYLYRTQTTGNQLQWTWAGWLKRSLINGSGQILFGYGNGSNASYADYFLFDATNHLSYAKYNSGGGMYAYINSSDTYASTSDWYHFVVVYDSPNATASDRMRLYVNGVRVTNFSSAGYPGQNTGGTIGMNGFALGLGSYNNLNMGAYLFQGYMADVYFLDGQALDANTFGQFSGSTWVPKFPSGLTYGANGFHLTFADTSSVSATGIGKDTSGVGNNWTPTASFSVTAGVTNDAVSDIPIDADTSHANFATLNPTNLRGAGYGALRNGNLEFYKTGSTYYNTALGTLPVSSGKWYWETTFVAADLSVGVIKTTSVASLTQPSGCGMVSGGYTYLSYNGNKNVAGGNLAYGAAFTTNGDVIGTALDMDNGTLTFYKNGVSQGVAATGLTGAFLPCLSDVGGNMTNAYINFGQRPFSYAIPANHVRLNTYNLAQAPGPKTVILTSGSSWTVPAGVTSLTSVEVIGGGGNGWTPASGAGGGGGGGAYSKVTSVSVTPGASLAMQVGGVAQDTWFNGASCGASSVCAKGGTTATTTSGGAGGPASGGVGTQTAGGSGAAGNSGSYYGGGGGGAAGPNGAGVSAGAVPTGGAGDNGSGGTGGASYSAVGGSGGEWTAINGTTAGSGGGGGGGYFSYLPGAGGNYGAGGGGGGYNGYAGAAGKQGVIIVTY